MEAKMAADANACYAGTAFACMEMIKSGTTFANDMYFNLNQNLEAFIQSGIKAAAGTVLFDFFDPEKGINRKYSVLRIFKVLMVRVLQVSAPLLTRYTLCQKSF